MCFWGFMTLTKKSINKNNQQTRFHTLNPFSSLHCFWHIWQYHRNFCNPFDWRTQYAGTETVWHTPLPSGGLQQLSWRRNHVSFPWFVNLAGKWVQEINHFLFLFDEAHCKNRCKAMGIERWRCVQARNVWIQESGKLRIILWQKYISVFFIDWENRNIFSRKRKVFNFQKSTSFFFSEIYFIYFSCVSLGKSLLRSFEIERIRGLYWRKAFLGWDFEKSPFI